VILGLCRCTTCMLQDTQSLSTISRRRMLPVLEHRRSTFSSGEVAVMTIDDLLASSKSIRPVSRDAACRTCAIALT
jgi:hypothetical protein